MQKLLKAKLLHHVVDEYVPCAWRRPPGLTVAAAAMHFRTSTCFTGFMSTKMKTKNGFGPEVLQVGVCVGVSNPTQRAIRKCFEWRLLTEFTLRLQLKMLKTFAQQ